VSIDKLRLKAEYRYKSFGSLLEIAGNSSIAVGSAHRPGFGSLSGTHDLFDLFVLNVVPEL
jgi:hypothetical protein